MKKLYSRASLYNSNYKDWLIKSTHYIKNINYFSTIRRSKCYKLERWKNLRIARSMFLDSINCITEELKQISHILHKYLTNVVHKKHMKLWKQSQSINYMCKQMHRKIQYYWQYRYSKIGILTVLLHLLVYVK